MSDAVKSDSCLASTETTLEAETMAALTNHLDVLATNVADLQDSAERSGGPTED